MKVGINKKNFDISFAICSCPADESANFNHIMVLLFELVEYSLHQLFHYLKKNHVLAWLEGGMYHKQIQSQNHSIIDTSIRKS